MSAFLRELFALTIYNPAEAGRMLMGRGIDRATGWMILGLAVILNTLTYFLSITLFPMPAEMAVSLLATPMLVLVTLGSVVVMLVFAFYWIGHALGGNARFDDILLMFGWLQYMRLAVQAGSLVLMLVLPGLAQLFVMGAGLYGVWIVINFLKVAHGFDTLGKAVGMVAMTLLGMTLGLSIFLSILGFAVVGLS